MKRIDIHENGIYMVFEVGEDEVLRLMHFSSMPFEEKDIITKDRNISFKFVEINLAGFDRPYERQGNKNIVTAPGYHMRYRGHSDKKNSLGRQLVFTLQDELTGVYVDAYVQFYDGLSIVRCANVVTNQGDETQTLEYISSFHYNGIAKEGLRPRNERMKLRIPHNSWQKEMNWHVHTLSDLGLDDAQPEAVRQSSNLIRVSNTGNWSTKEYLPMGYLENEETGSSLFWQIEHNGSWHWEIGEQYGQMYLALSGPNEVYSHWFKDLKPGDKFVTVPVAVGVGSRGFDADMGTLTRYRRRIRRPNEDNRKLKVIFNDYMNCLWGDPTTEKELPLIDAAAEAGCEYFCVDCGWYSAGGWWSNVGEWKESRERFPGGLKEVTDYIRSKGMIPGVWLELEVMGIRCEMAKTVPDNWFFLRHGKRVFDRSRYQLDYRNPEVRAYADSVIDRLVQEYGVGYIKMDYNIEPGIGTEYDADSVGEGLLGHERAYLSWLDGVFARYPELVIENCSSGGLRIDYAMLSRYSIQSTSDQEDYRRYATIAANSPTGLTPEQSAIWSYPLKNGDAEEVVFNMVNAMLLRIHQSGHLAEIDEQRGALVKEGIACYKSIREDISNALPFWPLGLSSFSDEWVCLGLKAPGTCYLAVWRREGAQTVCELPVQEMAGKSADASCLYPSFNRNRFVWNREKGTLSVELPKPCTARLFVIKEERRDS